MPKGQVLFKDPGLDLLSDDDDYEVVAASVGLKDVSPPMVIKPTTEDNSRLVFFYPISQRNRLNG